MSIPQDFMEYQESPDPSKTVIKHLQHKYKILLEPNEKEENHGGLLKAPEHLQVAIQAKKEWTLSWTDQFMLLCKRTFRARCRDYFDKVRLTKALGVSLLLGLLWWKSSINTGSTQRSGSRRTIWSSSDEHSKSSDGCFSFTNVIPSP